MARPLDQIVRDTLGDDRLTEIRLQAQLELLQDRVQYLEQFEPKPAPAPPPTPDRA